MNDRVVISLLIALVLLCGIDTVLAVRYLSERPVEELNPINRWLMKLDKTMSLFVAAKWASTMVSCGFVLLVHSKRPLLGRVAAISAVGIMAAVLGFAIAL